MKLLRRNYNKLVIVTLVIVLMQNHLGGLVTFAQLDSTPQDNVILNELFEDDTLTTFIANELSVSSTESISRDSLLEIEVMDISNLNIQSIQGIEHLQSLISLNAANNEIINIEGIQYLESLEYLNLSGNHLVDLRLIENLNLKDGDFSNQIFYLPATTSQNQLHLEVVGFLPNGQPLTVLDIVGEGIIDGTYISYTQPNENGNIGYTFSNLLPLSDNQAEFSGIVTQLVLQDDFVDIAPQNEEVFEITPLNNSNPLFYRNMGELWPLAGYTMRTDIGFNNTSMMMHARNGIASISTAAVATHLLGPADLNLYINGEFVTSGLASHTLSVQDNCATCSPLGGPMVSRTQTFMNYGETGADLRITSNVYMDLLNNAIFSYEVTNLSEIPVEIGGRYQINLQSGWSPIGAPVSSAQVRTLGDRNDQFSLVDVNTTMPANTHPHSGIITVNNIPELLKYNSAPTNWAITKTSAVLSTTLLDLAETGMETTSRPNNTLLANRTTDNAGMVLRWEPMQLAQNETRKMRYAYRQGALDVINAPVPTMSATLTPTRVPLGTPTIGVSGTWRDGSVGTTVNVASTFMGRSTSHVTNFNNATVTSRNFNGTIDISSITAPGIYTIDVALSNSIGFLITTSLEFEVYDALPTLTLDEKYIVRAIDTPKPTTEELILLSGAKALHNTEGNLPIVVNQADYDAIDMTTEGIYRVGISASDSSNNVVSDEIFVVVAAHEVAIGDQNLIFARDFHKRTGEVDTDHAVLQQVAHVRVFDLVTTQEVFDRNVIVNPNDYAAVVGSYNINFTVQDDPKASVTIVGNVTQGSVPVLTVPTLTELNIGDVFDPLFGVSAHDDDDGDLSLEIQHTSHVDTSVSGVYTVEYSVSDFDGNTVSAVQVVVIKDGDNTVIGDNYIIQAYHFVKTVSQVSTDDASIKAASNVRVFDRFTGMLITEPLILIDYGLYGPLVGTYPISLSVETDPTTTISVNANVVSGAIPVLTVPLRTNISINDVFDPKANISAIDAEDLDITHLIDISHNVDVTNIGVYTVHYSVTDSDNNTVTAIQLVVVGSGNSVEEDDTIIFADGFIMSHSQAQAATLQSMVANAGARAFEFSDVENISELDVNILGEIPRDIGLHNVTYYVVDGPQITVPVLITSDNAVINPDRTEVIDAKGVVMTQAVASTLDAAGLILKAQAKAFDISDLNNIFSLNVNLRSDVPTTLGLHQVMFATDNETTMTVPVLITNDNVVINPEGTEMIQANGVVTTQSVAQTLSDLELIALAQAKAFNIANINNIFEVNVSLQGQVPTTVGLHQITFTTDNALQITVPMLITTDNAITHPEGIEVIQASGVLMSQFEAISLDAPGLISKAQAQAFDISDINNIFEIKVSLIGEVPTSQGLHQVSYTTDKGTTITIPVLITTDNAVVNPEQTELIQATGVITTKTHASTLSNLDLINLARAKAFNITDMNNILEINVSLQGEIPTAVGLHQITFTTDNATQITVPMLITTDNAITDPERLEVIQATGTIMTQTEASDLNTAGLIAKTQAKGFDISDVNNIFEINVSLIGEVPTRLGLHQITFTTESDTTITVTVLITTDNAIQNPEGSELIDATGVIMTHTIASTIDAAGLTAKAQAKAFDISNINSIFEINVTLMSEVPTTIGLHQVTFTTDNGTTITVPVLITQDNAVFNPEKTEVIQANGIVTTQTAASILSLPELILLAQAQAFDITNVNNIFEINVSLVGELPNTVGLHQLTFTTDNTTQITVPMLITTDNSITNPEGLEVIQASGVIMTQSEANVLDVEGLIAKTQAMAFDISDVNNIFEIDVSLIGEVPTSIGLHAVSFTTVYGTSITIPVLIVNDNAITHPEGLDVIDATGVIMTHTDAATLDVDGLIAKAQVKAFDISDVNNIFEINVSLMGEVPTTIGLHQVTFTTDSGTEITIPVLITEDHAILSPDGNMILSANSFRTKLAYIATADFVSLANAQAYSISDINNIYELEVELISERPEHLGDFETLFTPKIDMQSYSSPITVSSIVQVYSDHVLDMDNDTEMFANDFDIYFDETTYATLADLVNLSGATAIRLSTGELVDIVSVTSLSDITSPGSYPVTFSTADEVQVTVMANVLEVGGIEIPDNSLPITGMDGMPVLLSMISLSISFVVILTILRRRNTH